MGTISTNDLTTYDGTHTLTGNICGKIRLTFTIKTESLVEKIMCIISSYAHFACKINKEQTQLMFLTTDDIFMHTDYWKQMKHLIYTGK